jgi:hypothetical protein
MFSLTLTLTPRRVGDALPALPEGEAYLQIDTETSSDVFLLFDTEEADDVFTTIEV